MNVFTGGSNKSSDEVNSAPKTPAEIEQERVNAEQDAALKKEEEVRGTRPQATSNGGMCREVRDYFRDNLRDYDSLQVVDSSKIMTYDKDAWCQRVKYRSRNGFGGMNLVTQVFVIQFGTVIDVKDEE